MSYWEGLFSGAMSVLRSVKIDFFSVCSLGLCPKECKNPAPNNICRVLKGRGVQGKGVFLGNPKDSGKIGVKVTCFLFTENHVESVFF